MPRIARVVVPGLAYHVTHRGNRRNNVFFEPRDRLVYKTWLSEYAARYDLEVWAYCLMNNHVHLLVVGHQPDSLSLTIGRTHGRYAQLQNRGHDWSGHFWANRFYSTPLDNRHLLAAVKYIELNPVRAGFVERVEEYEWSSARSHALGVEDTLLSSFRPFPSMVGDWSRFLASGLEQETLQKLRENTSTGRPTGSEAFIAVLEARLGRTLACQRRGPKPREQLSQEGEDDRAKG
jgi:putative transposase